LDVFVAAARDGNDGVLADVYDVSRTRGHDFTDSDFKDSTGNP